MNWLYSRLIDNLASADAVVLVIVITTVYTPPALHVTFLIVIVILVSFIEKSRFSFITDGLIE